MFHRRNANESVLFLYKLDESYIRCLLLTLLYWKKHEVLDCISHIVVWAEGTWVPSVNTLYSHLDTFVLHFPPNYVGIACWMVVSTVRFASLPEQETENIKYFIFSSGNQTRNLSCLHSLASMLLCYDWLLFFYINKDIWGQMLKFSAKLVWGKCVC